MKQNTTNFKKLKLLLVLVLALNVSLPGFSNDDISIGNYGASDPQEQKEQNPAPVFNNPVCLLVGLNSTELAYREVSSLSGFELFSVPYRSDIKAIVEQIKPSQIIIRHPSGFVGLYSTEGQLIRGIQTTTGTETAEGQGVPPSIIQPTQANPMYENLYYPGAVTGSVPHGGVGHTPPPKGRNTFRHLLKLAAFGSFVPFQYPGFFKNSNLGLLNDQSSLFTSLVVPTIPTGIAAASAYADARFDNSDYANAKTQPRDYMFQPVIEGY